MRLKRFLTAFLCLVLLAGAALAKDVIVTSFTPQGTTEKSRPQITVLFSGPVASKAQLNKVLRGTQVPLRFRPALSGTAKWVAANKLVFTPSSQLLPATRYSADFGPSGLRAADGSLVAGPQSFSFNRPGLSFDRLTILNLSRSRQATLRLDFSTEVQPSRLRGFLTVYAKNNENDEGYSVNYTVQGNSPSREIMIETAPMPSARYVKAVVAGGILPETGDIPQEGGLEAQLKLSPEMVVTDSEAYSGSNGSHIQVSLSARADIARARGYIELTPAIPFTLENSYDGFFIKGDFKPRSRVTLRIRKGFSGYDSEPLKQDFVKSFIFPDMPASVRFPADGMFLTPAEKPRVAVETGNIQTLKVSAWKLYGNNISVAALELGGWQDNFKRWAKALGSKKYRTGGSVNTIERRALDLAALGCDGEGVYLIQAENADPDTWNTASMIVCITDTALSARMYKKGLQVWAAGISDAKALAGADIKVFSSSNQLLLSGRTDEQGMASFTLPEGWQENLAPSLVTAEKDSKITFVKIGANQLSGRNVDTSGAPWKDVCEGLWILPRTLWQPGETLEARALVRSTSLELPGEFPLTWKLSSRGISLASGTITLDANGAASIKAPIPQSADSGTYSLKLTIPGSDDKAVAETSVQIEDFRPPQIKTAVQAPEALFPGQECRLDLSASYLFGGSGAGLKWELNYSTVPEAYKSARYPGYVFGCETDKNAGRSSGTISGGTFGESGTETVSWTPDADLRASSIIRAHLRLNVMEANGRWTGSTTSAPVYPSRALIGILAPGGDLRPRSAAPIALAAVDWQDNPMDLGTVSVEISKVTERYVMVTDQSGSRMTWQEEFSEPQKDSVVLNGTASYSFTPKEEGAYRLTFIHKDGRASVRLSVWEDWQGSRGTGASMPDRIEMKSDAKSYRVGSTARIAVKAPFAGRAVLTLGSDRPLYSTAFDLTETDTVVEVPVTEGMLPNGWAVMQVVRPESESSRPPYRALGALPIRLNLEDRRLSVSLEAPQKTAPGEYRAKIRVTKADGSPANGTLSLALVDRGILLLGNRDNPDPWKFFTRLRGMDGRLCDIYDALLPIEARGTALLHPAGGDDAQMARMKLMANGDMMSPVRAADYKPLALWLPDVPLSQGEAEAVFTVPEFSGALRLEAIAVDGASMGRAECESKVARPVVVDLALPRFAAPDDQILPSLNITAEQDGNASVSLIPSDAGRFTGPAGQSDWSTQAELKAHRRLDLSEQISMVSFDGANASLTARVDMNGEQFSKEVRLAVRPPYPLTSLTGGAQAQEGRNSLAIPDEWYPGTGRLTLSVSGTPTVDALALMEIVNTWGCSLERLISKGWITLTLPSLLSDGDQDLTDPVENRVAMNTVLAGLASHQMYDGSWSSWRNDSTDNWGSVSALHLLTALKNSGMEAPGRQAGLQWLRRYMAEPLPPKNAAPALNARAYGCYVMALDGDAPLGWMNWLEERISSLDGSGRALLAASYALSGDGEKAREILGAQAAGAEISLPEAGFRLLAFEALEAGGASSQNLASAIAAKLAQNNVRNAREASSMIMALGVFSENAVPLPVKARLLNAAGETVGVYDGKPLLWTGSEGQGALTLDVEGQGSLWYSWTSSGVPEKEPAPYTRGLKIQRTMVDAKTGKALDFFTFGQEVNMKIRVTVTSSPKALRVCVLLPAGFEAVSAGEALSAKNVSIRPDLRFDRLLLTAEGTGKSFEWSLPLRATFRGNFTVPPVSAEAMGNKGIGFLGRPENADIQ